MRKRNGRKGETLIETIVSFAIVLLTLTTITAVVQLCIGLNNRAMTKAEALETGTTALESGALETAEGAGRLILGPQYTEEAAAGGDIFVPFQQYGYSSGDVNLHYFEPPASAGGGG